MKAERRHDLKTNALARGVEGAPDLWREYGSRILLVVLVAAIVFLLVRYWNDKKARDVQIVADAMESANHFVHELSTLPLEVGAGGSATDVAENRQKVVQQAEQAINTVLNTGKDPKMLANAYLARGDLNWKLANFPELPGATTLPSQLQISNRDTLADEARSSYQKVLDPPYSSSITDVFYARMGLAAVAENQGQWDQAKAQYQAIKDGSNMPETFKELAGMRLAQLAKNQTPVLLVPPPEVSPLVPTTTPSTAPTIFGPPLPTSMPVIPPAGASQPSTAPAIQPTSRP